MYKFLYSSMFTLCILSNAFAASGKIYIDEKELDTTENCFHIHEGNNNWIETDTIHRDATGLYTWEHNLKRISGKSAEYEKRWKCPYCYQYWPIGRACQNPDCPSKYK